MTAKKFYPGESSPHGWTPRPPAGDPFPPVIQLTSAGASLTDLGELLGDPDLAWLRARAALRRRWQDVGSDSVAAMLGLPYLVVDAEGRPSWVGGDRDGHA